MFDVRLLEQRHTYIDVRGMESRVTEMGAAQANRALARLYADAERLQEVWWEMMVESFAGIASTCLMTPTEMRRLFLESTLEPLCWLSRRPLVAALSMRTLSDLPVLPPVRRGI